MTRGSIALPATARLETALGQLVNAATLSSRAARRKSAAGPKMDTKARLHARRFLKSYYSGEPGSDPSVGIGSDGCVTLEWVKGGNLPGNGSISPIEIRLAIRHDGSYRLAVDDFRGTLSEEGAKADGTLSLRIGRLMGGPAPGS
jgi:hypothetical protein